jgi:hypothetical protein
MGGIVSGLAWLIRKETAAGKQAKPEKRVESDKTVDLEEFLRTVTRPYKASGELGDRQQPAKPAVPSNLLPPPRLDERLDEALAQTFPASDPIAVSAAP